MVFLGRERKSKKKMREGVKKEGTKGQRFKESKKQNLRGRGY